MSADIVIEKVPKFIRRYGDAVYEGSNNTIAIFGTDRAKNGPAKISDGLGHINATSGGTGTGTIHFIAGRKAQDPDLKDDDSYIYLSQKTKVDTNLNIGSIESSSDDKPAAIIKTTLLRLVGRQNIKICVNDDSKHYIFIDGNKLVMTLGDDKFTMTGSEVHIHSKKIRLSGGCEKPYSDVWKSAADFVLNHDHMSAVGPTTPAQAGPTTSAMKAKFDAEIQANWSSKVER